VSNPSIVFVVDDDLALLKALGRVLRLHGYDACLFQSADALESHCDFERVVCLVLDIDLGGSSGVELRCRLKDAGINVPVIYITGNESPGIRDAALKSGCIAYVKSRSWRKR